MILSYITQNIPNITTQHGFKTKHSTNTALHNINNTVATGFNQPIPPTRTIAVAFDMSKAFDTVNIHTLIDKLTHTTIPHNILRYIANYIKGRMAYTTFRNHSSTKHQFKSGVPQGNILSPILFNIYTSDIPLPRDSVQLTTYADDITITAPHTDINIAKGDIQPYLQDILKWKKTNDLLLNTNKTTCTLLTPNPAEYNTQLGLQIDNTTLPMTTHPKILGLTLDPKLTYNRHIDLAATKAWKTTNILKSPHLDQVGQTQGNHTRREWCLCKSDGRDVWQGCFRIIGLSDPSTTIRRRGRSTTTTGSSTLSEKGLNTDTIYIYIP